MSKMTNEEESDELDELTAEPRKRSRARTVLLGLVALLVVAMVFLACAVGRLVLTVNETAEGAASAVEPITDRVRQLLVPATPVILPDPATIVHQINDLSLIHI